MSVNGALVIVSIMARDYSRYRGVGKVFVIAGVRGSARSPAGCGAEPYGFSVDFLPEGHHVPLYCNIEPETVLAVANILSTGDLASIVSKDWEGGTNSVALKRLKNGCVVADWSMELGSAGGP